jgi:hypothetical protein
MLVYAAIDFDDQSSAMADEINDVRSERRLPAEMRSVQIELAKCSPELLLGRRSLRSQTRGKALATFRSWDSA